MPASICPPYIFFVLDVESFVETGSTLIKPSIPEALSCGVTNAILNTLAGCQNMVALFQV
jgi:hypothetical protein